MAEAETFAHWLAASLADRGWRQGDLARATGVSQQTASRWLSGRSAPARPHVVALATALGVAVEDVLERTSSREPDGARPRPGPGRP